MSGLTKKQETFARAFVKLGNASEAYRSAYDAENMKPETVNKRASELLQHGEIAGRIDELRAPGLKKAALDAEASILELADVAGKTPEKGITYGEKINALGLLMKHYGLFEKDNKQRTEGLALEVVLVPATKR